MKNKFLTGALAVGLVSFGATIAESASAFDLKGCNSTPEYASSCQYVTNPLSGQINDSDGIDGPGFNTSFSKADPPNRIINVNNVNVSTEGGIEGFFGISNWEMFERIEQKSGSKTIDWTGYSSIMAVFKDGSNSTILGQLLKSTTTNFTWSGNPWVDAVGIQGGDISHVSFYGVKGTTPIPTPALLPSAIGMGIAAFRKKKREQGLEEATQEA